MKKQTYHYLKSYIRPDKLVERNQLLQIEHRQSIYKFSIERLVYRDFYEDEYKMYLSKKTIRSDQYRIVLYMKGDNAVILKGEKIICPEGTLLLLNPGQQSSITPKTKGSFSIIVFTFDIKNENGDFFDLPFNHLLNLYGGKNIDSNNALIKLNPYHRNRMINIFDRLFNVLDENKYNSITQGVNLMNLNLEVLQLFSFINDRLNCKLVKTDNYKNEAIIKAQQIIQKKYNKKITIGDLANETSISKTHLQHMFKKYYGITPIKYQIFLRIEMAKDMLLATSMTCKEIAYETGFQNAYYFSKQFKKNTGIAPGEYRKKHYI